MIKMPARHMHLAAILFGCLFVTSAQSQSAAPVVTTADGPVRGTAHDGVREFRGIPYAQPPVGALRWALPLPAKPWTETRDATAYGNGCPQLARYGLTEAGYNEDCLTINVSVPEAAAKSGKKLPVIVWIHGGAFVGGSTALYPLAHMATSGNAIVVSMNYRLGAFGFMANPAFDAVANGAYGLEDQRLALRWVQNNIAAFGGDPKNVTAAGESAGAASICMQVIAPKESKGLFHKAIMQSAGCAQKLRSVADAATVGQKVGDLVGCPAGADALTCLRGKPVKDLLEAASTVAGSDLMAYAPTVGTRSVPMQGAEALRTGQFVRVPMINGGNRDELRLYVAYDTQAGRPVTADNYMAHLTAVYGERAAKVEKKYPMKSFSSPPTALGSVMSDYTPSNGLNNCLYLKAGKLAAKYVTVYEYEFADRAAPDVTPNPGFEMGAVHSAELPYQFPGFSNTTRLDGPKLAAPSQLIADQMMAYWTSFAAKGMPRAAGAKPWIPYQSGRHVMRFEPGKLGPFDGSAAHNCAFWQKLYPEL
ncbi:carboxylesterase family protein [Tardiphaga sp.]|uniref:carboxylesterase/lipase family protein n=1 Tax=Tardiphaga sp. TaxID=1926292 RepID=UPI00262362E3|nr:carboxylesterase family protein [Tardiphaga sp.]MDB5616263.1 Carboxylesterase, type [Tardiphaga sp.]